MQQKTMRSFSVVCSEYWLENDKYSGIHALKNSKFTCTEFSKFLFKGHVYDLVGNRGIRYHHQFLVSKPMKYWTAAGALTLKWKILCLHIQNNEHNSNFLLSIYPYLTAEITLLLHETSILLYLFNAYFYRFFICFLKIISTLQAHISLVSSILNHCKD